MEYVHKFRAAVRISLPGEDPIDGELSLGPRSESGEGQETLLDLLNSRVRVIPFHRAEDGRVWLLARTNINWVVAGQDVAHERVCPTLSEVTREETVHVTFLDGRGIDGVIRNDLPVGINRASDFLNGAEEFFALQSRLGVVMVNKARVRDVMVYAATPRPSHAASPHR